jgi:hypothetical protein
MINQHNHPQKTVQNPLPVVSFDHEQNQLNIKERGIFAEKVLKTFNGSSLDEDARKIKILFYQTLAMDRNLVEIRTKNWIALGTMLNQHKINVEAAGHNWRVWAVEHFEFLKHRRREIAMEVSNFGPKVLDYLYMGLDRLYDFFHKLQRYQKDQDFGLIAKRFGYMLKVNPESEEDKVEVNKNADKIREFFKFKGEVTNTSFDRELLLGTIEAGGTFNEKDFKSLKNQKNPQMINDFLRLKLATGSSSTKSSKPATQESIHIILSKLIQTVRQYQSSKQYPPFLSKQLVNDAVISLNHLKQNI